jgi:hypothetical protein
MTELTPSNLSALLTDKHVTVAEVLTHATDEVAKREVFAVQTPVPQDPALPEKAQTAVRSVSDVLAELTLPENHRQLSPAELERTIQALEQVKDSLAGLKRAEEQIKTALFNHFDDVARQSGKITDKTPLTKHGWAAVEDKDSGAVEGLDKKAVREVSGGKPYLTEADLARMVADGVIDHTDYLSMTQQVRRVDENDVLEWIRKNPTRAADLARGASTTQITASLHLRTNR